MILYLYNNRKYFYITNIIIKFYFNYKKFFTFK